MTTATGLAYRGFFMLGGYDPAVSRVLKRGQGTPKFLEGPLPLRQATHLAASPYFLGSG